MRRDPFDLLNPTTRAIVRAAEERGIPWFPLYRPNLVQLGYGRHRRLIQGSRTDRTSLIGGDLAQDKRFTKKVLQRAAIPCPRGFAAGSPDEAIDAFRKLGAPVAIKPVDGNQGQGITLGVRREEEIPAAFERACECSEQREALVEQLFVGRDYRVIVVGGAVVAAAERTAAHVVGDGTHTVAGLMELENRNPLRGEGHESPLSKLRIERAGVDSRAIPAEGEIVLLCDTANLSTGGTANDVTDRVHPSIRELCERAARMMDLDVCGLDLVLSDISRPIEPGDPCGIIEINTRPGLRMHEHPSQGRPRPVGRAIVDLLFPPGAKFRVPIVGVAASRAAKEAARTVRELLEREGMRVGEDLADPVADAVLLETERLPAEGADVVISVDEGAERAARRVMELR